MRATSAKRRGSLDDAMMSNAVKAFSTEDSGRTANPVVFHKNTMYSILAPIFCVSTAKLPAYLFE
jgi:hypothetical protein